MKLKKYLELKKVLTDRQLQELCCYNFSGRMSNLESESGPFRHYIIELTPKDSVIHCLADLMDKVNKVSGYTGVYVSSQFGLKIRFI